MTADTEPGSWTRWCRALRLRDRARTAEWLIEVLDHYVDPCTGDHRPDLDCYDCYRHAEWRHKEHAARVIYDAVVRPNGPEELDDFKDFDWEP